MSEHCPTCTCQLTDQFGNLISPYAPGAVLYTLIQNDNADCRSVSIEGYIAVYMGQERISPPIPFCIVMPFCLSIPEGSSVVFRLENFNVWAVTCQDIPQKGIGRIKLLISIDTYAFSKKAVNLLVPQVDAKLNIIDRICICADQIFDSTRFHSEYCLYYKNAVLQAEISQYNTLADGEKRTFLNSDEIKEYGGRGILSPEEVSCFNVYVNGLLQPKKNYILKKGELTFITRDIPSKDQTVIIFFVTWKNFEQKIMKAIDWQYSAVSDGYKKVYVNSDELPGYESYGIPSPDEVSSFNLYINGVLQPQVNYRVKKGILELTTRDAPTKGALIILESIIIQNSDGLFRIINSSFNAYSNKGKIYTNGNEIHIYGMNGILSPDNCSYQNLFINAVLQPKVNYFVHKGCLILKTENNPSLRAPITLQSIYSSPAIPHCKTKISNTASAHLAKIFIHDDYFNDDHIHNVETD